MLWPVGCASKPGRHCRKEIRMLARSWLLPGLVAVACACGTQSSQDGAPAESPPAGDAAAHDPNAAPAQDGAAAPAHDPAAAPANNGGTPGLVETGSAAAEPAAAEPARPVEEAGIESEADEIA